MNSMSGQNILVIGAGIVGVSTALWLQRDGHNVTLMDRIGPAAGASSGNAGVLAAGSVVPITIPGLLPKVPNMLFNPKQPLFLRWRYLPKLVPFLRRYLKHANNKSVDRVSKALNNLLHDAADQHVALARGTPASDLVKTGNYLFGYVNEAAYKADHYSWNIRRSRGVKFNELNADALVKFDPTLKGRFGYGVICENHGRISDPGAYVAALVDHFKTIGGTFTVSELQDFDISHGRCQQVTTSTGTITVDKYILTTGAWSGDLAKKLGITIPLESERGYHIEFVNPSISLRAPVMVAGGKFVINSMDGRLRCAGVIEFGGLDAPASTAPLEFLKRQMRQLFPDLTYDRIDEWMGHRPATSDSIPVIGISPKADNVLVGYGHHHIGLSGGPKTGRWLASLANEQPTNVDLSAYAPDRIF